MQQELLVELVEVQKKKVDYIKLTDARSPFSEGACLLIKDPDEITLVVRSIKNVTAQFGDKDPSHRATDFTFQLVISYSGGGITHLSGYVLKDFPKDAYIEKNRWVEESDGSYTGKYQKPLSWPDIGPFLKKKISSADHKCRMDVK